MTNTYFLLIWPHEWVSEVAQLCPTLCNPIDCSLPGSSVHGIFQARVLEWVAISFSRIWPHSYTFFIFSYVILICFIICRYQFLFNLRKYLKTYKQVLRNGTKNFHIPFSQIYLLVTFCCFQFIVFSLLLGIHKYAHIQVFFSEQFQSKLQTLCSFFFFLTLCSFTPKILQYCLGSSFSFKNWLLGTSLVVQWIGICLSTQGTWVQSLVREDSTCHRAAKPVCFNYWAHRLQLPKPMCLKPVFYSKRSHCSEKFQHCS